MILAASILLVAGTLAFVLLVRPEDLAPEPALSPAAHLEDKKAAIYENLRDLQFEFRLGKLSEADYQKTKTGLQAELAALLAEIDRLTMGVQPAPQPPPVASRPDPLRCPACGARFEKPMKFCGECGKPMPEAGP
jgi:hypothetical protein